MNPIKHRTRLTLLALTLTALTATAGVAAAGGVDTFIAAVPGSFFANYATPAMVVTPGGELAFLNDDLAPHNVVANGVYGPDDNPWCGPYAEGRCPLIWSPTINIGSETAVHGTDQLQPGDEVPYHCTLHPGTMHGTLLVVEDPTA